MDALSDDGQHGLTLIAFLGSVFSPYYAWARRHGPADPLNHIGLNVALYGPRAKRWALTERGRARLSRDAEHLAIGPSSLTWSAAGLSVEIDEIAAPLPARIRGRIRLHPEPATPLTLTLDPSGRHRWTPLAPRARIEVQLDRPALHWQGTAYFDSNAGDAPLEQDFVRWDWSRSHTSTGVRVLYDITPRGGPAICHALQYNQNGEPQHIPAPPRQLLHPPPLWRMPRATRAASPPRVASTLEDTPFYARSLLAGPGGEVTLHESLSLDRFRQPIVQLMLPFRMPRRAR
jgi:carotenoid 1,2-hydratase